MTKSLSTKQLEKLSNLLAKLSQQAKSVDNHNAHLKSNYFIKDISLFSKKLFNTESDKFSHYTAEVQKNIDSLGRLIRINNSDLAYELLLKVEQQITALSNGMNANAVKQKEANFRQSASNAYKAKSYKKAVQKVLVPTQQLYQNLSEHYEFERRLAEMIAEREQQRAMSASNQMGRLNQEVLALHQRLGRCRQAISKIEKQIELAEKRS